MAVTGSVPEGGAGHCRRTAHDFVGEMAQTAYKRGEIARCVKCVMCGDGTALSPQGTLSQL